MQSFARFSIIVPAALGLLSQLAASQQPEPSVDCTVEPIPIAYGENTDGCAVDTSTDSDQFEFEGQAGELVRILLDAQSGNLDPCLRMIDPSGAFVDIGAGGGGAFFCCGNGCTLSAEVTLTMTGTHTLIVSDSGTDEGGFYLLSLERVPPLSMPPPVLLDNTPIADAISYSTDFDFFAFAANAGDIMELRIDAISGNLDPCLEVLGPDEMPLDLGSGPGVPLCCGNGCSIVYSWTVVDSGLHTVLLSDSNLDEGGNYSINLTCLFGSCPPPPFQTYGTGLAGTQGIVPTLTGSGASTLGNSVTMTVADALGAATGLLVLAPQRAEIPIFGGVVLVFPFLQLVPLAMSGAPGAAGAGSAAQVFAIPTDVSLVGEDFFLQAGLVDAGAVQGVSLTAGLKLTIG